MKRMGAKSTVAHQSELLQEHSLRGYPTEKLRTREWKTQFFSQDWKMSSNNERKLLGGCCQSTL